MIKITELNNSYRQRHLLPISGSDTLADITLEFKPNFNCWFFSLTWGDFVTNNEQIVASQNILRQYQNIIPFGIAIITNNLLDPLTLECWTDGTASFYVLNSDEVVEVEENFYGN